MSFSPFMCQILIQAGMPEEEIKGLRSLQHFNRWMKQLGYETRAIPGELMQHTLIRLKSEVKG